MNSSDVNFFQGKTWIVIGAVLAAVGVALGAFGAHGLQDWLPKHFPDDAEKRLANWESAVRYQMYHALAIILVGMFRCQFPKLPCRYPAWFFLIGISLFSGCLYGWVLTDIKTLVMIVPLGGLSLIVGWVMFAISASRISNQD